jgi:AcrR family transcriptional regulator
VTAKRTRGVRAGLSRGQILDAALALADREGLGAVTMRRLGAELGVEAMTVYHHVPNKTALIDGLVERIFTAGPGAPTERPGASADGPGAATDGLGAATDGLGAATDRLGAATDGLGAATDGLGAATDGPRAITDGPGTRTGAPVASTGGVGASTGGWRAELMAYAGNLRRTLLEHPAVLPVIVRPAATPATLDAVEHYLGVLVAAGFTLGRAVDSLNALTVFVVGHTSAEVAIGGSDSPPVDAGRHPLLASAIRDGEGADDEARFHYAADALLSGFEVIHRRSPSP